MTENTGYVVSEADFRALTELAMISSPMIARAVLEQAQRVEPGDVFGWNANLRQPMWREGDGPYFRWVPVDTEEQP